VRYLGLDVGGARIGLALADDVLRTARPHHAVARPSDAAAIAAVASVVRDYEVDRLVVGLPINMDGSEGPAARGARAFATKLGSALHLPVDLQDERLSTFEAAGRLRDQGFSARDQKEKVDAQAAAVILQEWLDGGGA
jgi:putative holliday junction resolvase